MNLRNQDLKERENIYFLEGKMAVSNEAAFFITINEIIESRSRSMSVKELQHGC